MSNHDYSDEATHTGAPATPPASAATPFGFSAKQPAQTSSQRFNIISDSAMRVIREVELTRIEVDQAIIQRVFEVLKGRGQQMPGDQTDFLNRAQVIWHDEGVQVKWKE